MSQKFEAIFYVLASADGYYVKDDEIGIVTTTIEAEKFATKKEAENVRKYRADKDKWHVHRVKLTAYQ